MEVRLVNIKTKKLGEAKKGRKTLPWLTSNILHAASETPEKAKELVAKSWENIVNVIDLNENGEIDVEDIIIYGIKTPGIRINRAEFLQKELFKNYPQEVIDIAIKCNPARAGIPSEEIDRIAGEVIKYERKFVTRIATVLGVPGGIFMLVAAPADFLQNYAYMIRAAQKLLYLYGFPEIVSEEKGEMIDAETVNILIICLGVMYGVAGANKALVTMGKALGKGVEKKLLNTALTKGAIYPIVKNVAKWFNIKMTKQVFAGAVNKGIPIFGAFIGGGITYLSFGPCCNKLKVSLQDTMLSNPTRHDISKEEDIKVL